VAKKSIDLNPIKVKPNFVPSEKRRAEYKSTYDRLMERAKGRVKVKGVHHNHHIIPKSLGGSNEKSNIAVLTYDEHFLAHWLLTKFTTGESRIPMLETLMRMMTAGKNNKNSVVSGWQYAIAQRARSEATALWHKTPEGQEAMKKGGRTRRAFNATPEGKQVLRKAGRKGGATRRAFYETPEGQEARLKTGTTLRAFYATPEGQEVLKKAEETRRAFYETPEGQEVLRKRGEKIGATKKARGSLAGESHYRARLTENIVRQIRIFEGTNTETAFHFGITRQMSYQIRTGRTWKHVK
jgi:hypothetical protein